LALANIIIDCWRGARTLHTYLAAHSCLHSGICSRRFDFSIRNWVSLRRGASAPSFGPDLIGRIGFHQCWNRRRGDDLLRCLAFRQYSTPSNFAICSGARKGLGAATYSALARCDPLRHLPPEAIGTYCLAVSRDKTCREGCIPRWRARRCVLTLQSTWF
jgi:hypothetical protein